MRMSMSFQGKPIQCLRATLCAVALDLFFVSCSDGATGAVPSVEMSYVQEEADTGSVETMTQMPASFANEQDIPSFPRNLAAYLYSELHYEAGSVVSVTDFFNTQALREKEGVTDEMLGCLQLAKPFTEEQLLTAGTYPVEILAGEMCLKAKLIVQDTTPPVITVPGFLTGKRGETISYKQGVTVTDNSGAEISLEINIDEVMVNMVGSYPVYYRATDSYGNTAEAITQIIIEDAHVPTEEENLALAKEILEEIVTDGMTDQQKATAVFDWCHDNITPRPKAVNWDTVYGIYDGLYYKEGNCYTAFVTSTYLLSILDIPFRRVSKKFPSGANHVWSLVQVESGWYHFDTTKFPGGFCCLLQTDAQVDAYAQIHSEAGTDRFHFQESNMPERSTIEIVGSDYRSPG